MKGDLEMSFNRNQKKAGMPPIITILILLIIISIAGITRLSIRSVSPGEIHSLNHTVIEENVNQNILKHQIINLLINNENVIKYQKNKKQGTYYVLTNCLKSYLDNTSLNLSEADFTHLKEIVEELVKVITIEHQCDFTKMSLDGRAVSIEITRTIYNQFGLKLETNIEGEIEKVTDQAGNTIYHKQNRLSIYNLQIQLLIIVLSTLLFLLLIIFIVVKKNNLFEKEDEFNEFKEKRYV